MQKNLFRKYLGLTSLIVGICLLFIMITMITLVSNQWRSEKRAMLSKNATTVSILAGNNAFYDKKTDKYVIDEQVMQSFIKVFSINSDSDIFITDLSGNRLMGIYSASQTEPDTPVPIDVIKEASNNIYSEQTSLNGAYQGLYYVVGTPIRTGDSNGNTTTIGVVFMATSSWPLAKYWFETLHMFFWVGVAIFMVSLCLVWGFTYRMVCPLRLMSVAAHNFGNGDFSQRVPVTGEDEIGELAKSFNSMAESLTSSESMRRTFIANVSHELKTPMTTIAGFIDGILDGTIPADEEKKYLSVVSGEVKRLSRLVQSMLALSRIDSGELKIHQSKFDLTSMVFTVLITFENAIEKKNIVIRGPEDFINISADGDSDLIYQVIYNLIDNAVKFTDSDGYIELEIFEDAEKCGFRIQNSGAGIAPDEQKMIFDRFYKTDKSRSRDKNGMGLGLYLVKTIINLHGGEISVKSKEGSYTEFAFWIPKLSDPPKLKDGALPTVHDTDYTPVSRKNKKSDSFKTKEGK